MCKKLFHLDSISRKQTLKLAYIQMSQQIKMNFIEIKAVSALSTIMALRMLGLFMVIPLFALYAQQLQGSTPFLLGIAIGVYGLTQASLQIPFGFFSDLIGRKPIIFIGLSLFIIGSLVASRTNHIYLMIMGRALQGAGAIGSTLLASMADLTREETRTFSMAVGGITIGLSFLVAMFLGPVLSQWLAVNGLFLLASFFGLIAIFLLFFIVPPIPQATSKKTSLKAVLSKPLFMLDIGIFLLHAIFTASFIALPIDINQHAKIASENQWHLYLPALAIALLLSLIVMGIAEKTKQIKFFFLSGIFLILLAQSAFLLLPFRFVFILISLSLFFTGFSLLEAFLPSLISRIAHPEHRGSALGIFSSAQFLGIFVGGILGGWIFGHFDLRGIYSFCIILTLLWFLVAFPMKDLALKGTTLKKEPIQPANLSTN